MYAELSFKKGISGTPRLTDALTSSFITSPLWGNAISWVSFTLMPRCPSSWGLWLLHIIDISSVWETWDNKPLAHQISSNWCYRQQGDNWSNFEETPLNSCTKLFQIKLKLSSPIDLDPTFSSHAGQTVGELRNQPKKMISQNNLHIYVAL